MYLLTTILSLSLVYKNLLSPTVETKSPEDEEPDDGDGAHDHHTEDGNHEDAAGGGVELGGNFFCN